jgi:rRNA maturation endonuclease Nob1
MAEAGAGFGLMCPDCNISIDVQAVVGADPERCPNCGKKMVPNPVSKISAGVTCNNCNSRFGLINSDTCPNCGEPFA